MSETITIGVDHGYAAMKTTHCAFPTGLVGYEHEPYTQKDVLEYGIVKPFQLLRCGQPGAKRIQGGLERLRFAGQKLRVVLLLIQCEPQRFARLPALFQLLLGLPQLRPGGLQPGAGGGVLPDGPEHISQPHGQPAFRNRESS